MRLQSSSVTSPYPALTLCIWSTRKPTEVLPSSYFPLSPAIPPLLYYLTFSFSRWSTLHYTYSTFPFTLHSSLSSLVGFPLPLHHLLSTPCPFGVAGRFISFNMIYPTYPTVLPRHELTGPECTNEPEWFKRRDVRAPKPFLQRLIDAQLEPLKDELHFTRQPLFENEGLGHFLERLQTADCRAEGAERAGESVGGGGESRGCTGGRGLCRDQIGSTQGEGYVFPSQFSIFKLTFCSCCLEGGARPGPCGEGAAGGQECPAPGEARDR